MKHCLNFEKMDLLYGDARKVLHKYKYSAFNVMVFLCAGSLKLFAEEKPKPNVIFIISDDLNTHLGTYGDTQVISPNINALANQGIRFDRAYCNYPLSLPSRSSFLTGIRPERTKVLGNRGNFREALPNAVTLPRFFHDQGYLSASCGKVLYPPGQDDVMSWDMKLADFKDVEIASPAGSWGDLYILQPDGSRRLFTFNDIDGLMDPQREAIRMLPSHQPGEKVHFWGPSELSDDKMPDGQIAAAACNFLEQHGKDPFFLAIGFMKPHVHFVAPKKYFDLYKIESMPKPDFFSYPEFVNLDIGLQNASKGLGPYRRLPSDIAQRAIHSYYACISFVDAQVGKVMDKLKELQLDKNTIVVFIGDNGFLLGNHGYGKASLYEGDVRVPLIVSAPGFTKPGSTTSKLVEFVDIYPTLAELCGLPSPVGLDGVSFVPVIKNTNIPWKEAVFSRTDKQRMVRTAQYKYTIAAISREEQLFNVDADPLEMNNLVKDAAMKDVLESHRAILAKQLIKEDEAIKKDLVVSSQKTKP